MYQVNIYDLAGTEANKIIEAFRDRDIITEWAQGDTSNIGNLIICNIHEVTITPLMMWILHHINRSDYNRIVIS